LRSPKGILTIVFIQSVNDFHAFHAFIHEELENVPLLHFHEMWHAFGMAPVISAGLGGQWP
jgi:hypothetical protein